MSKRRKQPGSEGPNLAIIVTPFLDMSFQILAFFIMTYHPSDLEGHIDGTLLPPAKPAVVGNNPLPEKDPPLSVDLPKDVEAITVAIKAVGRGQVEGDRTDGMPSRFEITKPEDGGKAGLIFGDARQSYKDAKFALKRELERFQKDSPLLKSSIKLVGDPDLRHQFMVEIYDVCRSAGYKDIYFSAPYGTK